MEQNKHLKNELELMDLFNELIILSIKTRGHKIKLYLDGCCHLSVKIHSVLL